MIASALLRVGLAAHVSAACTRSMLQEGTSAYLQAVSSGQPKSLSVAPNITYLENDTPTDITKGILSQPITIDFNRSIYDTAQCAAATEISAATNQHPYVINTRLLFTDSKISTIQSVVADDGDWIFNATSQLTWTKQETWDPIPEEQRDTRAVIQAAGDAYLDSWGNGSVSVPYGTPCARLEGGAYTGERSPTANTCTMPEFPQPFAITKRAYVVDEVMGAVDIFDEFPFIDTTRPEGTSCTNFLRVEGGRIRYIHEVTICATRNCGR